MAGALNSGGKLTLMTGAGAGHTAGQDLCAVGYKLTKTCNILIIDAFYLINAKAAYLSAALMSACTLGALRTLGSFGALCSLGRS